MTAARMRAAAPPEFFRVSFVFRSAMGLGSSHRGTIARAQFFEDGFPGLPDVSGAEGEDEVAGLGFGEDALYGFGGGGGVFDGAMAEVADALSEGFGGDAFDGRLGRGVDVEEEEDVGLMEGAANSSINSRVRV